MIVFKKVLFKSIAKLRMKYLTLFFSLFKLTICENILILFLLFFYLISNQNLSDFFLLYRSFKKDYNK